MQIIMQRTSRSPVITDMALGRSTRTEISTVSKPRLDRGRTRLRGAFRGSHSRGPMYSGPSLAEVAFPRKKEKTSGLHPHMSA